MEKIKNLLASAAENDGFVAAAIRVKNGFYVKLLDLDVAKYNYADDIESVPVSLIQKVFISKPDINGIIIADTKHTSVIAKAGVGIPPILDDFAQIVGVGAKTGDAKKLLKLLKGKNACVVKNIGAFATGRTLNEAETALKVLEKTAKVYIEADLIGGAKSINRVEAKLMNVIYKMKYSKKDQAAKLEELEND